MNNQVNSTKTTGFSLNVELIDVPALVNFNDKMALTIAHSRHGKQVREEKPIKRELRKFNHQQLDGTEYEME
jgi:hypothetical protein